MMLLGVAEAPPDGGACCDSVSNNGPQVTGAWGDSCSTVGRSGRMCP